MSKCGGDGRAGGVEAYERVSSSVVVVVVVFRPTRFGSAARRLVERVAADMANLVR